MVSTDGWTKVEGNVSSISVSRSGFSVWGVTPQGKPYIRTGVSAANPAGDAWQAVNGTVKNIGVGDFAVWAVVENGDIYCREGISGLGQAGTSWKQVPGKLEDIDVGTGPDGNPCVWGVNKAGLIYQRTGVTKENPAGTSWVKCDGGLKQISCDQCTVVGITPSGSIYRREKVSTSDLNGEGWTQLPGNASKVGVAHGVCVWAAQDDFDIFESQNWAPWHQIEGKLRDLSLSGSHVWGVHPNGAIYIRALVNGAPMGGDDMGGDDMGGSMPADDGMGDPMPPPSNMEGGSGPHADPDKDRSSEWPVGDDGLPFPAPKLTPTVFPRKDFDPAADARAVREAMKGMGTDEETIVRILGTLNNAQRQELARVYSEEIGRSLMKDLKSEFGGSLEDCACAMIKSPADYDAWTLRKAMKGMGTKDKTLIEILCTRPGDQLREIKASFTKQFERSLTEDIRSETSGTFEKILLRLAEGHRKPENVAPDANAVKLDALNLRIAGEDKWGTNEDTFIEIFTDRSFRHLRAVCYEYCKITDYDLERSIERECGGDFKRCLVCIVQAAREPAYYFCTRLHEAMSGIGTSDAKLIRILVSRSEIDLGDIQMMMGRRREFGGKTLHKTVNDDVRGHYQRLLFYLMGVDP